MSQTLTAVLERPWRRTDARVGVGWRKLMMWLFIVNDALLFAGLLAAYGFVRLAAPAWPDQAEVFHLGFIALMTFILISSSATMAGAVASASRADPSRTLRFLFLTMIGGAMFLGCQAYEWTSLIAEGVTPWTNPWHVPLFGASFFALTGFHGAHVTTGLVILAVVAGRSARGRATAEGVELAGLYWHFVDLVWVFIFTLFYLI